ncbi:MAG: alpha-2-macroglobulin family protein [Akkermansiaceae bacterium]
MKDNDATLAASIIRAFQSIFRFMALLLSSLVGTWQPPGWMRWIFGNLGQHVAKRPRIYTMVLLFMAMLGLGLQQWQRWWEMHRPQERQLVQMRDVAVTIVPPSPTTWTKDKAVHGVLKVNFSYATAPLDLIKKTVADAVVINPEIPGTWTWSSDRSLEFSPQQEWQAGQEYALAFQTSAFPAEVRLSNLKPTFRTLALDVRVMPYEFYTQPDNPDIHQVTATLTANYALTKEILLPNISMSSLAEKPEAFGSSAPVFTLTPSKSPNQWYLRSSRVKIPSKSEEIQLTVAKSLKSSSGGASMARDVVAKAVIPDRYSALQITSVEPKVIKNDQGEPKQFLTLATSLGVSPLEMTKHVHLYRLTVQDDTFLQEQKKTENDVTAEMIARATSVPLELVQQESDSPFPKAHAYQFFSPMPGRLFLMVDAGLATLGGFEMAREYRDLFSVPPYPLELEMTGKGSVMALQGEKLIQFKSRGVDFIKITFGRVRATEVNHMITQNDYGDFANPDLQGHFSKDSLVRSKTFVLRVNKKNQWEACFTPFDMVKAMAVADASDPDPSRGFYFIDAEAVIPSLPGQADSSVYSRVDEPEDAYYYDDEYAAYREIDDDQEPKICVNADGKIVQPSEWFSDVPAGGTVHWRSRDKAIQRFVMLTDLGLLVKTNADSSREVFVMSLRTQNPVAGAKISLLSRNGSTLAEAMTDSQGRATLAKPLISAKEQQAVAILTRLGNDTSFLSLRPGQLPALDYSRYHVDGILSSRAKAVEAHVFTERGVYRPGDTIHFASIVKRRDWESVIEGLPVQAMLSDSEGNRIATRNFKLPADGLVDGSFITTENSPTGVYELSMWVLNRDENAVQFLLGRIPLRVEDFRPDRMKMKVSIDPAPAVGWAKLVDLKARISLENLFGAAAGDRVVKGEIALHPADFRFDAWKEFQFYNPTENRNHSIAGRTIPLGEVKTSATGEAEMTLGLAGLDQVNMSVAVNLEAWESDGGHGVREQKRFLVSPWDSVVGYDADCELDYLGKDSGGKVKFVAIDQNLKPVAIKGLRYRIQESRYVSVLRQQDDGSMSYESQQRQVLVREEKDVNWEAAVTEVSLDTSRVGRFQWQVLNENSEVICQFFYRVVGKGDEDRSLERESELGLTVASARVQAGEEVEVSIVAPYSGAGLITLERDKVLYSQWFKADTKATVHRIPIPQGLEGTVYCNVSFVRSIDSEDVMMSPLSYATQPISILPVKRQLQVELSAPKLVKPGEDLKVQYRTNQPSRVIIYAVDEGIHQITQYKRPQPLDFFFRKQALEVRTQQWFDLLMPEYRFIREHAAFGGGAEGMPPLTMTLNPFKRKRDAPVVWWSGILNAGPDPKELSYTVPDYFAGTLTLMAVAVNETRAGSTETSSLVRSPLVLTNNAPTTVTPGDEFTFSVTVTNLLEQDGPADVKLRIEPSSHLQIMGESAASLTIEKSREATHRFRLKALDVLGSASIKCHAAAGVETSVRTETISLRPATPFRTQVRSALIRTKDHEQKVSRTMYEAYRRNEVVASPLPVVLALGMRDYMNSYAYDCTEQLTSKGLALLSYRAMKTLPQQEESPAQTIGNIIAQLQSRQSNSGGFGYWQGSTADSDDFLNVYVAHFLLEAKEDGFAIPQQLINRVNGKLHAICQSGEAANLAIADRKAYAIYLLTRQGERPNGLLSLRECLDRTQANAWQNRLCGHLLAATYAMQQKPDEADKIAAKWKLAQAADYQTGEDYWTRPEVDALLCFALRARHFSDTVKNFGHADWQKLYGVLWQQRYNTITAATATLGMREYAKLALANTFQFEVDAQPRDGSAPISLIRSRELFAKASFADAMKSLDFRLSQKDGDAGLFYQFVEEGFDRELPNLPQKDGVEVYRELTTADGKPIESLEVGQSLTMTLRIRNLSNIPLGDLVMIDLLPGGFAVEPGALRPGLGTMPGMDRVDVREDRNLFFFRLQGAKDLTIRYALRATCAGDFVVPPVFAESMYDRGINGVGLGRKIKVTSRE